MVLMAAEFLIAMLISIYQIDYQSKAVQNYDSTMLHLIETLFSDYWFPALWPNGIPL